MVANLKLILFQIFLKNQNIFQITVYASETIPKNNFGHVSALKKNRVSDLVGQKYF